MTNNAFRKLFCFLFHRKDWIEFRTQNWVRKCIYCNGVYDAESALFESHAVDCLCLKCGRNFQRKVYITEEEKLRAWVVDACLKDGNIRETYKIEEDL